LSSVVVWMAWPWPSATVVTVVSPGPCSTVLMSWLNRPGESGDSTLC
jgi:hypothetical protein